MHWWMWASEGGELLVLFVVDMLVRRGRIQ